MSKRSSDDLDNDHTDELPVLLESDMLDDDPLTFSAIERIEDTNEHTALYRSADASVHDASRDHATTVADLQAQLAAQAERDRDRERLLADKDAVIADLKRTMAAARESADAASAAERRMATQVAVRDARVAELTTTIEKMQDAASAQQAEIAQLRAAVDSARQEAAALQSKLDAEPASPAPAAPSELQELLEANAALRDYIEGRRASWEELQASRAALQTKMDSLEAELATAAKRAADAEAFAARESSRAVSLRAELVDSARRVAELERELRDSLAVAIPPSAVAAAAAPATVAEPTAHQPGTDGEAPAAGGSNVDDAAEREGRSPVAESAPAVEALAQLEGEVEYKRQQVAAQLVELRDRDQRLAAAAGELERLRRELASLRTEVDEGRSTIARLERGIIDKDRALEARDTRITTLQDELRQRAGVMERLHALDVSLSKLDARSPHAAANPGTDTPAPALLCLTGDAPKRFALTRETTSIGRGPQCDLQILTHFVSREHARITMSGGSVVIEDLGSRNGVFVNSVRIDRHALQQGDLVTIGETQFRFVESMAH